MLKKQNKWGLNDLTDAQMNVVELLLMKGLGGKVEDLLLHHFLEKAIQELSVKIVDQGMMLKVLSKMLKPDGPFFGKVQQGVGDEIGNKNFGRGKDDWGKGERRKRRNGPKKDSSKSLKVSIGDMIKAKKEEGTG